MFTWLFNRRPHTPSSNNQPVRRAALVFEPLEAREVPAVLGAAGAYTVFGLGNTEIDLVGNAVDRGNLAVGRGGSVDVTGHANVSGAVSLDRNTSFHDPKAPSVGSVQRPVDLSQAVSDALNGSAALAAMTPTQSFGAINGSKVVTGNGGVNVINAREIDLHGSAKLTLSGGANDYFYVNVSGQFRLEGNSAIVLAGGVQASHVIFNIVGKGDDVVISGNAVARGTFLAPARDFKLSSDLYGSVIGAKGHDIRITGDAHVFGVQFQEPVAAAAGTATVSISVRYSLFGGDEQGPVTDATVTLTDANGTVICPHNNGDGTYSCDHLAAGSYTVSVSSDFGDDSRVVTLADGQPMTQDFMFS